MCKPRGGGRAAAAVLVALVWATGANAVAEPGDRHGVVLAARVELQRQLGDWLTKSLAGPAEPYRVDAAVRLEMRGVVREVRAKQENITPGVKIGAKNKVKLPGLGMVEGGGGQTALMPEIAIEGGTRVTESVSRQLETEVTKMTIMLFVDPAMPKDRRDFLVRLASDLAGLDRGRGDEVVVEERPLPPAAALAGGGGLPTHISATLQTASGPAWNVAVICLTALLAAAILAFGLSRRSGDKGILAALGRASGGEERAPAGENGARAAGAVAQAAASERKKRREEMNAFPMLADATPRELVQIIAESDPHTASAIVDLVGLDEEAAKLVEAIVPPQRRLEIGIGLATSRTLTRDQLAQLENVAAQALQKVRNRVPLGGPSRLAEFLALAPSGVRREVLEGVASRDKTLAEAARQAMLLFEDLPRLSDATLRQIVASIDPGTVALALVGAPDVRDVVLNAVSKRLRGILEVEEEVVKDKPPPDVETARRALEDAMRQLNDRGALRSRAA